MLKIMSNYSLADFYGLYNCSQLFARQILLLQEVLLKFYTIISLIKIMTAKNIQFCEAIFDGVQCWPPTPAGVIAALACPENFKGYQYDSNVNATRECSVDGRWTSNRTNYGSCTKSLSPDDINLLGVYISGYSLSILCLCSALFIFCHFKSLKCTRNFIHCHLFSAFILRSISILALFIINQPNQPFSRNIVLLQTVTMLSKLAHLVIFHWMLIEGLYLFKLIYWTYGLRRLRTRHFAIIGWGLPILLTVLNTITNVFMNPLDDWIRKIDFFTDIPIILILIMNSIVMMFIIHALVVKLQARRPLGIRKSGKRLGISIAHSESSGFNKTHRMSYQLARFPIEYRKAMKATLVLMPLLGFNYIILITPYHDNVKVLFTYLNAILTSTQGFLVALIYCFLNIEVRKQIRTRLITWQEGYGHPLLSYWARIWLLFCCCIYRASSNHVQSGQRIRSIYHCQGHNQTYIHKSVDCNKHHSIHNSQDRPIDSTNETNKVA